jgi:hypothetical protein
MNHQGGVFVQLPSLAIGNGIDEQQTKEQAKAHDELPELIHLHRENRVLK